MISIYLHSLNQSNTDHITEGGIRKKDWTSTHKLSQEDIDLIVKQVEKDKTAMKIADAIHYIFNTISKEAGNKTSVALEGYEIFNVEDYFPILTDAQYRNKNYTKFTANAVLENSSWTKERAGGKNPIMLENAIDVLFRSTEQMARYQAFAVPLRNARMVTMNPDVRDSFKRRFGKNFVKTFEEMYDKLDGKMGKVDELEGIARTIVSNISKAILGANFAVAYKQVASFAVAQAEIDAKYLAIASTLHPNWKLIEEKSSVLWHRRKGYVNRESAYILDSYHSKAKQTKALRLIMFGDSVAIGKIWKAVELETKAEHKDLKVGSDEYWNQVAERTEFIVSRTQPNYHPLYRSRLGNSGSLFLRLLSMFSTQRNQNYNIMYDAALDATIDKNKTKAVRKIVAVGVSNMLIALVSTLTALYRGYDDDPIDEQFMENMISTMVGNFYFLDKIASIKMYSYGDANIFDQYFADTVESVFAFIEPSSSKTLAGKVKDFTISVSSLTGVPVKNVERELVLILGRVDPKLSYQYSRLYKEPTRSDMYSATFEYTDDEVLLDKTVKDIKKSVLDDFNSEKRKTKVVALSDIESSANSKNKNDDPDDDVSVDTLLTVLKKFETEDDLLEESKTYAKKQIIELPASKGGVKEELLNSIIQGISQDGVTKKLDRMNYMKAKGLEYIQARKIITLYYGLK